MTLIEALKAVAPAVGDGKIVSLQAYCLKRGSTLHAGDGFMWANALLPFQTDQSNIDFCVRHESLLKAFDREDALIHQAPNYGVRIQAGRSRIVLKGIDPVEFPFPAPTASSWQWRPPADFKTVLGDLSKFCAGSDGHIWQQGVHIYPDFAFAANSHALIKCEHGWQIDHAFTIPPWAVRFLLAQDTPPDWMADHEQTMAFHWEGRMSLRSTRLIEEPPDNIVSFATNLSCPNPLPVPDNLKETVERVASYGATQFTLGAGKLTHMTPEIEFEEDVADAGTAKVWGTKTMLAALSLATHIDLTDHPAKWKGGPYIGAFSGLSG
jgi:hypothetical protein